MAVNPSSGNVFVVLLEHLGQLALLEPTVRTHGTTEETTAFRQYVIDSRRQRHVIDSAYSSSDGLRLVTDVSGATPAEVV
jgi:hypothetical protein